MSERWARSIRPYHRRLMIPKPTSYSKPFWEGTKRHELLIQECVNCGKRIYPPQPICPKCLSENFKWIKSSGKGKILTFTTIYAYGPSWTAELLPYTIIIVRLEEGINMMSHLIDCKPEEVKCEMEVEVVFEDVTEEFTIPKFRPI